MVDIIAEKQIGSKTLYLCFDKKIEDYFISYDPNNSKDKTWVNQMWIEKTYGYKFKK